MDDAEDLVLRMGKEHQQLAELLHRQELGDREYRMVLKALDTAVSEKQQKGALEKVLTTVSNSMFLNHMTQMCLMSYVHIKQCDEGESVVNSVLKITAEILKRLPECAGKCFAGLAQINGMLPKIASLSGNETLLNATADIMNRAWKIQERRKAAAVAMDRPPNDYKEMSVIPVVEELKNGSKPFLRAAVTDGAYKDLDHYLDVQFRLMREDFVHPFRKGLTEFVTNGCKKEKNISGLRMYFNVRILKTEMSHQVYIVLQLDYSKYENVMWDFSKLLIAGSLLCLSKDNFSSVLFAIVSHRDDDELKNGRLTVAFQSGLHVLLESSPKDTYVMAETTTYFEAYRPVLEGLQEMSVGMPLESYIVKCEKRLKPPKYLLPGVHKYDMSSIMKSETSHDPVPVLNTSSWPEEDQVCLNESQLKAIQLALTKEVALIKGPPGTGKTFVGLKVVQLLLNNKDNMAANVNLGNDPILVVCYTNHALDQFLEGILSFCPKEDVIRVGGRSQSEKTKDINLSNILKKRKCSIRRSANGNAWVRMISELESIKHQLNYLMNKKVDLSTDILSETTLRRVMAPAHFHQVYRGLHVGSKGSTETGVHLWLSAPIKPAREVLTSAVHDQMLALILKWSEKEIEHTSMENSLENLRSVAQAPIHVRAALYQKWLGTYVSSVSKGLEHTTDSHVNKKHKLIQSADTDIVWNDFMKVIPPKTFLNIRRYITEQTKYVKWLPVITEKAVLKCWVLGSWQNFSGQLDDIETLSRHTEALETNQDDDMGENEPIEDEKRFSDIDSDNKELLKDNHQTKENMSALLWRASTLGIQLDDDNDEGDGSLAHQNKLSYYKTMKLLQEAEPLDDKEEIQLTDLWHLDLNTRFALYKLWLTRYEHERISQITDLVNQLKVARAKKVEIESEESISILRNAKVIGMTTTGAAKYRTVMQAVGCRIVVVEEAAEVLEAHVVTSLNENCNHLILIGDQQQLRPNLAVYELARYYGLDISLFERLVKNGVPHVSLTEQHRMRESISKVMRHIYPDLKDDESVKTYEHIEGVTKDMFFIQHEELESSREGSTSKSNVFEAQYLVSLCQYLLNQGYKPSQITILATYAGQIRTLKREMDNQNNGRGQERVQMTTVDNFQGEENDIILLSLVRSNEENSVGFLKVDNRICVALSRAKKGLFVIGNFKLLTLKSKLWTKILETAVSGNLTGTALPVVCRNHPGDQKAIKKPSDFDTLRPEGGCGLPCDFRLQCGHSCTLLCHGYDLQHELFQCKKTCTKAVCELGHACVKMCFEECGPCLVKIPKTIPLCGHTNIITCSNEASKAMCLVRCPVILNCSHHCGGVCGRCIRKSKHNDCGVQVEYTWPCGHARFVPCFQNPSKLPCVSKCQVILDCGHPCAGDCSGCFNGTVHKACVERCCVQLPCGHPCHNQCGLPCGPCTLGCPTECRCIE